jgi:hypothetical protein
MSLMDNTVEGLAEAYRILRPGGFPQFSIAARHLFAQR